MRAVLGALVLLLAVSACGSAGESYGDAAAVAKAASMSSCSPDTVMGASDAVSCKEGRADWFKSADARDGFKKLADSMASLGGSVILYGSDWAIECNSKAFCDKAKATLGGTLS